MPYFLILSLLLAVKGVTYTALIRIGVCWGSGTGALERGIFEKSWGCYEDQHINTLYTSLIHKLNKKDAHFGPFDAVSLLIGDKNARFFSKKRLGLSCRPPLQ